MPTSGLSSKLLWEKHFGQTKAAVARGRVDEKLAAGSAPPAQAIDTTRLVPLQALLSGVENLVSPVPAAAGR